MAGNRATGSSRVSGSLTPGRGILKVSSMEAIEFFCAYEVKGKGNSKQIVRSKAGRPFLIEPKKNRDNAKALQALFSMYSPDRPFDGPVRVTYRFQYPWRTNHPNKVKAMGRIPKDTSPDLGQLTKQCDDVLQACGFVTNDSQIASYGETEKIYTHKPGVHVRIEPLNNRDA